jgi:hypothetical protein
MASVAENSTRQKPDIQTDDGRSWTALRLVITAIILTAACLKAWQWATMPSLGEGLLHARWFNVLVVEFELFFGIWLLFGLLPRLTWLATLGCFTVFAAVALYKALQGESSCGCFGAVTVNPWMTMGFDLTIVVLLLVFQERSHFQWILSATDRKKLLTVFVTWFVLAVPALFAMLSLKTMELSQNYEELAGKSVTLEPKNWLGKPFPLDTALDVKELPNDWRRGGWTILLHHRNCAICEELLRELAVKADVLRLDRLAIIEVPDGAAVELPLPVRERAGLVCSLRQSTTWFAPSPVVLMIENGHVTKVQIGHTAREMIVSELSF